MGNDGFQGCSGDLGLSELAAGTQRGKLDDHTPRDSEIHTQNLSGNTYF